MVGSTSLIVRKYTDDAESPWVLAIMVLERRLTLRLIKSLIESNGGA